MHFSNISQQAQQNDNFRKVVATNPHSQFVLMSVEAGDDIGEEVHHVDQILCFVSGVGKAIVGGEEYLIGPSDVVIVPSGTKHNFINTGSEPLKLYTVYAPAEHPDGTVHKTKAEAVASEAEEHNHGQS